VAAPGFRLWFSIGIFTHRRVSGRLRRVVGALTAAACMGAVLSMAGGPAAATQAAGKNTATVDTVTTGPATTLGEPVAAGDAAVSAVAMTTGLGPSGSSQVAVWTRRAGSPAWHRKGVVLPAGFGVSYDPAAAAAPGGPLLVVAGTAPPGESGIPNGSVAIANVYADGRLGPARLVSDQRGTGSFDDRPAVAVGQNGTVWVAWSQGPNSDAGANSLVGAGDRLEVAVSHDGGRTFGAPVTMPADGGHAAFGARLAPLPGGRVAVSWTETTSAGLSVFVAVLGPGGQLTGPWQVLTGEAPPATLPSASFFDFPAGDIVALPGGSLVVAVPIWQSQSGRSVIELAAGTPGGQWRVSAVAPPAGADLLLPALGLLPGAGVRLVCAVHTRSDDSLGYDWADFTVTGQGAAAMTTGLTALTPAPPGPGFYEIGEELSLTQTPAGLLTALVVGGSSSAALQTAAWPLPAQPAPATVPTRKKGKPPAVRPGNGSAGSTPSTPSAAQSGSQWSVPVRGAAAALIIFGGALAISVWAAKRRAR
jgi:hypothetical protein